MVAHSPSQAPKGGHGDAGLLDGSAFGLVVSDWTGGLPLALCGSAQSATYPAMRTWPTPTTTEARSAAKEVGCRPDPDLRATGVNRRRSPLGVSVRSDGF